MPCGDVVLLTTLLRRRDGLGPAGVYVKVSGQRSAGGWLGSRPLSQFPA